MRNEVHHRHEQDEVKEQLRVAGDRAPVVVQSVPRSLQASGSFTFARMKSESSAGAPPRKKSARHPNRGNTNPVGDRREEKTAGVAFLEKPREKSPPARRNRFHRERSSHAPLAAHADPVEQSENEKDRVSRRESGKHLDDRIEQNVQHERNPPPVPVGHQAEEERADGAHGKARRQGERDRGNGFSELAGDGNEHERQHEEVERVQRPAEKTGDQRVSSVGVRRSIFHRGRESNARSRGRKLLIPRYC